MSGPPMVWTPPAAYRGTRSYIHSTDLYEGVVAGAAAAQVSVVGAIELRIRALLVDSPRYIFSRELLPNASGAPAVCFLESDVGPLHVVIEATSEPVTERKQYDETPVATLSRLEGRTAILDGDTGLRPIEAVTALAVLLHKASLPPSDGRRWMLAQLTIKRPLLPIDASTLKLTIERLVGGSMTRTRIDAADETIGHMMFILSKAETRK